VVGADARIRGDRGRGLGGGEDAACSVERAHPRAALGVLDAAVGDVIELGGRRLSVVHTPGHSPGHIALHEPDRRYLVTGDVLYRGTLNAFYESTDPVAFAQSISRLCELERVTTILPGHNELGLNRDELSLAQTAFQEIEQRGALHHGSGLHEFGVISIRL
jgi:glyoxylase-like metal-dependent hydrolase (beta-lactamase superfamily II)